MRESRLRAAIAGVALIGAGVAAYLTYGHYDPGALACASGGCETVQRSSYATLAGIPVALFGLIGYLGILGSALFLGELARAAGVTMSLAGAGYAGYLLYVQLDVLHAICEWCVGSDALLTVLALLTLARAAAAAPGRMRTAE